MRDAAKCPTGVTGVAQGFCVPLSAFEGKLEFELASKRGLPLSVLLCNASEPYPFSCLVGNVK